VADDLEPVRQQFEAEVGEYIAAVHEAADGARDFAGHAEEAKVAVDGMRDGALEAGEALGHVRDEAAEASHEVRNLGQSAEDTAAKLDLMQLSGAGTFLSLGQLAGIIGAVVVAAAAVAPAVASMGLGFAAFGAFALPAIMQVSSGLQTVSTDTQAVQSATTAAARSTAVKKLQQDWAGMSPPIAQAVKQILAFKNEFESLSRSSGIQGAVLGDLTKALQIARQVLPEIIPLAQAGAKAISGLLTSIGQGLQSAGFRQFLSVMTSMVVPATQAITRLAFTILGVLGNALEQLAPLSIPFINFVSQLIGALGGPAVAALHVVISLFLGLAHAIEPLLPGLSRLATMLIGEIGSSFAGFIPVIQQVITILGGSLIKILNDLLPVFANLLTPNSGFMLALGMLPGLLRAVLPLFTGLAALFADPHIAQLAAMVITLIVAFRGLVGILALVRTGFALLTAVMAVNPIILIAAAIAALAIAFIYLWDHSAAFRKFWIGLWHDITAAVDTARHDIASAFDTVRHAVATLAHDIAAHFDEIRHDIAQWADDVRRDTDNVIRWFEQLPGRILHALGNLGHLLWNAGMSIVDGLINGIESMAGAVGNALLSIIPGPVRKFASFLGIGSPSRVFHEFGVNTLQGYINGLKAAAPMVHATLAGIGAQVASAGLGIGTGPAGSTSVHVQVPVTLTPGTQGYNDPRFQQYLQSVVQEAILRYQVNNPSNGLSSAWGTR
jgi:phage-related protein